MPILEWLAVIKDKQGQLHTFRQPSEDPVEGFGRVLEEEKKGNLVSFWLDFPEKKRSIGVDLNTGFFLFSIIYGYHPAPDIAKLKPAYRLIYFRRRYRDIEIGMGKASEFSEIILAFYVIGWQTTIEGENIQRMMFINPQTLEITIKEKR